MGFIHEAMDRAKETIEKALGGVQRQYEKVFEIICGGLHRPLQATSHILNPRLFYIA